MKGTLFRIPWKACKAVIRPITGPLIRGIARICCGPWIRYDEVVISATSTDNQKRIEDAVCRLRQLHPWAVRYLQKHHLMLLESPRENGYGGWGPVLFLGQKQLAPDRPWVAEYIYYWVTYRKLLGRRFFISALWSQKCRETADAIQRRMYQRTHGGKMCHSPHHTRSHE